MHALWDPFPHSLNRRNFAAAEKLVAVGCFCIGTNQVDLDAAARRGIPVFNAPFSNTRSVAEMVLGNYCYYCVVFQKQMLKRIVVFGINKLKAVLKREVKTGDYWLWSYRHPVRDIGGKCWFRCLFL
ncbi:hypothetical protein IC611_17920 [Proteus mirabilis]